MKNLVGQTLKNRYQVQEHLGRGGMAEVYKVWDNHRSTMLAMKVMHEDLAIDKVFMRRFRREADTLARLQHPNIVRFYGLEEEGRLAYMLLDYIEGDNLKLKIFDQKGPYPSADILHVMQGVCQALAYAHKEGLIHNDIKPGNIMINQHGQVLLADFGIARLADAATATMVGAGTPAYMAPEQVKGLDPVPQSDIYALGIVLYEMLTGGERPFTGEQATTTGTTSAKVRWEQINLDPPSPRLYNAQISPEVEKVVLKCMAKNPDQRYQTALDLLTALETAIGLTEFPETQSAPITLARKPASSFTQSSPQKSIGTIPQAPWYKGWPFWLGLIAVAVISLAVYSGVGNINYHPEPIIETVPVAALVENAVAETEEPGQVDAGYVTDTPDVVPSPTVTDTATPESADVPESFNDASSIPLEYYSASDFSATFLYPSGWEIEVEDYAVTFYEPDSFTYLYVGEDVVDEGYTAAQIASDVMDSIREESQEGTFQLVSSMPWMAEDGEDAHLTQMEWTDLDGYYNWAYELEIVLGEYNTFFFIAGEEPEDIALYGDLLEIIVDSFSRQ